MGDEPTAEEAAAVLSYLRENEELARTDRSRKIYRKALEKIKGTDWEKALFHEPTDELVERFHADFELARQRLRNLN